MDRKHTDSDRAVVTEKGGVAKELARRHYQLEPDIVRILHYVGHGEAEARVTEPIKLLEVNAATVPSGVMPLHFGPAPASGILYPSVIIEVTPDEFQRIQAQELKLPEGWQTSEELPRSEGE